MSRLWACDRCGITTPHPAISTGTLPSGWQCVAVRVLPESFRDVCPGCYADLDQALQDWFREGGGADVPGTHRVHFGPTESNVKSPRA